MALLTDDLRAMLDDSVDKFIRDRYDFHARQALVSGQTGYSADHWAQFADMGWLGIPFAEQVGGLGGGIVDTLGLMRRFGRGLVVEPYLAVVGLAGQALAGADDGEARDAMLSALVAGDVLPVLAWEETASRGNPAWVELSARGDGGGWCLDGEKITVLNAPQASHLVVSARVAGQAGDADGIELFLLPARAEGVEVTGFPTIDGHRAGQVRFQAARARPLTFDGRGGPLLRRVLDQAGLMLAAEGVGVMESLLQRTVDYTRTRRQFGVPIASFQVLQHRMADMYIATTQAENLLNLTAARWLPDGDNAEAAAALKAQLCVSGRYVGQQAIQLHGGIGMTDELDVGHYFKRLTSMGLLFGDEAWQLRRIWQAHAAA
ncbi:MAG: acyl-CoA dehydrogenase family protein [Ectothiorhodospiraceae bacterium]|nr:acyl-CoA dehydrogenase family protein [Ectothiorhodospiraceae bacterium]